MDKAMMKALEADGEKLRQLTGEDHGPFEVVDALSDEMSADAILARAASGAMPRVEAVVMAMSEKGNAVGLERAADTLDALADDIIAGRAPVTDIKDAAMYLRNVARKKRAEAEKVLNRN